ncbi:MAG: fimbrial protein [Scandinavium sp.]|uniref:fimbrial protein n=1 Tax=Scandinavium sp. TaxID=2830653 RepID=UPI003F391BDF
MNARNILWVSFLLFIGGAPAPAVFATSTISFSGKIYDEACTVEVNGETDATVALGNYSKDRIATTGATTDAVPFTLSLTNCPQSGEDIPTQAMFRFHGDTTDANSSWFNNADEGKENGASGVGVVIEDAAHNAVVNNVDTVPVTLPASGESADFLYYAAMVNNGSGSVTGGNVDTILTWTVSYK